MLAFFVSSNIMAQEWTKAQSEVWEQVQKNWDNWKTADVETAKKMFHDKYQGWNDQYPLPIGKEKMLGYMAMASQYMELNYFDLEPARIAVTENAAVVDYYYFMSTTMKMGEKPEMKEMKGKMAEFWIKDKDGWKLLGDFGTEEDVDDDDD